jgi:hydrogenase maturation protease
MTDGSTYPRIAIFGLGNVLLKDDGIGVHAARELMQSPPEGVVVAEVGVAALNAMSLLEESDVVIAIDAVKADGPPGSIYRFDAREAEQPGKEWSLHSLGLIGVLQLMPKETWPEVIVLGMEPEEVALGMELTPQAQMALPLVVKTARDIVTEIREENRRPTTP